MLELRQNFEEVADQFFDLAESQFEVWLWFFNVFCMAIRSPDIICSGALFEMSLSSLFWKYFITSFMSLLAVVFITLLSVTLTLNG